MRRALRNAGLLLLLLLVLILGLAFDFLRHGGQFTALEPRAQGPCREIPLRASAEDIRIDRDRGVAYLSYLDRRALVEGKPVRGTVMLLDLGLEEPRPRAALIAEPPGFRPHGMSLYVDPAGVRRLFVISHPPDGGHSVEIFREMASGALLHEETVRDPLLFEPNAILVVGSRQFYVVNDTGARNGFERMLEMIFRRGMSDLVYYDGSAMRVADSGLATPAGIAASRDLLTVYVGETTGKRMRIYRRDVPSGRLKLLDTVELPSAPDNLSVDADGNVWIAAHAKLLALIRHFGDASRPAPTQILRYAPKAPEDERLETVFAEAGVRLSAGSVGAVWRDKLVIGSITERKVLLCQRS